MKKLHVVGTVIIEGGKVEEGESEEQALLREISEVLESTGAFGRSVYAHAVSRFRDRFGDLLLHIAHALPQQEHEAFRRISFAESHAEE